MDRQVISCSRGATATCSSRQPAVIGARRCDMKPAAPRALVANILQEPFGRNLPPLLLLHGLLVHPPADRGELQALIADIAIERHLVAAGAPLALAGDEIGEIWLVAAPAAIHELRTVAAEAGLRIFRREPLHLLDRAAD